MSLEGLIKKKFDELMYEAIETIGGKNTKFGMNSPSATT